MIYLDYSATTPPASEAIDAFVAASLRHFANPNSLHGPGREAEQAVRNAADGILQTLGIAGYEVVFTGGASEANNLAIKGYAQKHQKRGKHLITTPFEHASVTASFAYLAKQGFIVDVVETGVDGIVTPAALERLIRTDTILVSVAFVNSELGIVQPVEALAEVVARHSGCVFHTDATQAIGKLPVVFANVGLASFAAHKFYGLKGVGALLRRNDIILEPQIHGGRSTTAYRSGTPSAPLAVSMAEALRLAVSGLKRNYLRVVLLHARLLSALDEIPGVVVNSPAGSVPHIVNVSVLSRDADDMLAYLDSHGFCVSKQTACSIGATRSEAVYRITGDERRAQTSLRVSLSHWTTETEVDAFVACVKAGVAK